MKRLSRIYIILIGLLLMSQPSCSAVVKKTPMQKAENMAYCWTPDGKVAFYRRIDHWIKMEPDPFPGGGGVYDDYEKNDEAYIVVRDPETKEERVLNKILDPKYPSAPYIRWMDWSSVNGLIVLSAISNCAILPTWNDEDAYYPILVVFVHGMNSSPEAWGYLIDPETGKIFIYGETAYKFGRIQT